jgi:hypothetical protein
MYFQRPDETTTKTYLNRSILVWICHGTTNEQRSARISFAQGGFGQIFRYLIQHIILWRCHHTAEFGSSQPIHVHVGRTWRCSFQMAHGVTSMTTSTTAHTRTARTSGVLATRLRQRIEKASGCAVWADVAQLVIGKFGNHFVVHGGYRADECGFLDFLPGGREIMNWQRLDDVHVLRETIAITIAVTVHVNSRHHALIHGLQNVRLHRSKEFTLLGFLLQQFLSLRERSEFDRLSPLCLASDDVVVICASGVLIHGGSPLSSDGSCVSRAGCGSSDGHSGIGIDVPIHERM